VRPLSKSGGVETATQALHRLTSMSWEWYALSADDPDHLWSPPVDDPRVVASRSTT
jgi:hypothetical protein